MERFRYTLTSSTVVSAGQSDQRSNVRRAHQVIPGATLRGALGAIWWSGKNPAVSGFSEQFRALFEGGLLVGQAVPEDFELLSASSLVCKYRSQPGCASYVYDVALAVQPAALPTGCPTCRGPLAAAAGWRRIPGGDATVQLSRTRGKLTERETADKGKLFTRHAIAGRKGELCFTGSLMTDKETAEGWNGAHLRVGGGRSLDYGNSILTLEPEAWPGLPPTTTHAIRLVSPAILVDEYGGPVVTTAALEAELRRVSKVEALVVQQEPSWLRTEPVSGWHMRSRLPKVLDWAVAPGSVVIVEGLSADGWARLKAGIGWRTAEGYGQIEVLASQTVSTSAASTSDQRDSTVGYQPGEPAVDEPGIDDEPPPATDAENQGVLALRVLRPRIRLGKLWVAVKRDLLTALRQMAVAETAAAFEAARSSATFSVLMAADSAAARAVLAIPKSHVPGTIAKLEGMR